MASKTIKTTADITLPDLAHEFAVAAIDRALEEIFNSPQVDLYTWRVANKALLTAKQAILKDAALWVPKDNS